MPIKRFTVEMPDDPTPFSFRWSREEEPTQRDIRGLYDVQRSKGLRRWIEPEEEEEEPPFIRTLTGVNWDRPRTSISPPDVPSLPDVSYGNAPYAPEPVPSLSQWWEALSASPLPEARSAETAFRGLGTISRAGDWLYNRLVRPTISPATAIAGPIAATPPGRAALAGAGTIGGAYGLKETVPRAYEEPTLENIADVGLSAFGAAAIPIGYKAGWFSPTREVIPPGLKSRQTLIPPERQLPAQAGFRLPEDVSVPTRTTRYTPAETRTTLAREVLPEVEMPPDYPRVGVHEFEAPAGITPPPVGGEYGIKGRTSFATVPERAQIGATQEWLRPVERMLRRTAEPKKRVAYTEVTETIPGKPYQSPIPGIDENEWQIIQQIREAAKANVDEFGRIRQRPKATTSTPTPTEAPPIIQQAAQSDDPTILKAVADYMKSQATKFNQTPVKKVYDKILTSGWTQLERMGDAGKELSRLMQFTRAESGTTAGAYTKQVRAAVRGMSRKKFEAMVNRIEEGNLETDTDRTVARILAETGKLGEQSGLEMSTPSGEKVPFKAMSEKYFPHMWKPGTFNEESLINTLVQEKGMTAEQARFVVENAVKRGPRLISPQHMRSLNLPGYMKTKEALIKHIDDIVTRSVEAKHLGTRDVGSEVSPVNDLIKKTTNPELASDIIRRQLGRITQDPNDAAVVSAINTAEATAKLPLFAISNMNQAAAIGMKAGAKNFIKSLGKTVMGTSAEETGAMQNITRNMFYESGQNIFTKGMSKAGLWEKSEEFLRTWAGHAGKQESQDMFAKLKKNPADKTARAKLDNLLLEDVDKVLAQDTLTPEQINRAGFRFAEMTQGLVDPADLPPAWSKSPYMKLPTLFKRFAFQQGRIIKNMFKEAKTPADRAKLAAKMGILYELTGEATTDVKEGIKAWVGGQDIGKTIAERGKEGPTGNFAIDRIADNMGNAYAFGILQQFLAAMVSDVPTAKLEFFMGPGITDILGVGSAALKTTKEGAKPLAREAAEFVPLAKTYLKEREIYPYRKERRKPKSRGLLPSMPNVIP